MLLLLCTSKLSGLDRTSNFFQDHDDFNEFIDELAANYDYVTTESIGESYEGRDMRVIKIEKAGAGAKTVFIEAGACKVYIE